MQKIDSAELVYSIKSNKVKTYAFGAGYIYECCKILHGYKIDGFIHTHPESLKNVASDAEIYSPNDFIKKIHEGIVVIIYTESYKQGAEEFCLKNEIPYLHFDDPAHIYYSPTRIGQLTNALNLLSSRDLIPKRASNEISKIFAPEPKTDFVESLIDNLPGHWGQYIEDICKALTKAVYWHQLCGGRGDIAEFGTASGVTSGFIAAAMAQGQSQPYMCAIRPTTLHLFDSFMGLPEVSNPLDIEAGWQRGMFSGLTEDQLKDRISRFLPKEQLKIYPGWFKDTLKSLDLDVKFSLVHIDCDLYESTIDVLDHLFKFNHILDGCTIFFDDWNCGNASPRLGERRAWREITEKYNLNYSDCGEYSCAGHKFIVHIDK